ncbi:MAG: hypothetical protein A3K19_10240 [Lentisphaerae bacterium RIFOXYB12_FULL_65_16]|nr:MAG: hypothetical protein A3K18_32100 [Lentisphaerae bacterium RIFOXYA12_64_32]OGV91595.1 MAG: hypothetical protein A3K19_10240 [Lentisphaerae bacterium RIFOXYB12_FULL_65_16]
MVKPQDMLRECTGFEWDAGNDTKNWDRHDVTGGECEQIFFNRPLMVRRDREHSRAELRYFGLGCTDAGRLLFVAFTVRATLIRVISARDMTARERQRYEA